jgi:hypothetical protein
MELGGVGVADAGTAERDRALVRQAKASQVKSNLVKSRLALALALISRPLCSGGAAKMHWGAALALIAARSLIIDGGPCPARHGCSRCFCSCQSGTAGA